MGRVPDWDEVWGWHEFEEGGMNAPDWCALCDCLRSDHTPKPKEEGVLLESQQRRE